MKSIAIDGSRFQSHQPTGVEVYSDQLIPRVIKLAEKEKVQVELLVQHRRNVPNAKNVHQVLIVAKRMWTLIAMSWAVLIKKVRSRTLFVPSHILPIICPSRSFVTIHDLAWKYVPESYSWKQRLLLEFSTHMAVRFATGIITVSEQTAQDIRTYYNCHKKKLHVVHSGFDYLSFVQSFTETTSVLEKLSLQQQRYFVYIGRVEDKKNVPMMIRAFLKANLPEDIRLIIIGKEGVGYELVEQELQHDQQNRITMTGYMDNDTAYTLLKHARAFVFPSRFEGFGFPVLESFALDVPVISTLNGALKEVAGGASYHVEDEQDLVRAFEEFSTEVYNRVRFIEAGRKQLKKFSWEKTAQSIWNIIRP